MKQLICHAMASVHIHLMGSDDPHLPSYAFHFVRSWVAMDGEVQVQGAERPSLIEAADDALQLAQRSELFTEQMLDDIHTNIHRMIDLLERMGAQVEPRCATN